MSEFSNNGIIKNKVLTQPIQSSSDNNIALNTKHFSLLSSRIYPQHDDPGESYSLVNQELRKIYRQNEQQFFVSADGKRIT